MYESFRAIKSETHAYLIDWCKQFIEDHTKVIALPESGMCSNILKEFRASAIKYSVMQGLINTVLLELYTNHRISCISYPIDDKTTKASSGWQYKSPNINKYEGEQLRLRKELAAMIIEVLTKG